MTLVKICGITNIDDALMAVASGADALGFNFYTGSKRYISPDVATFIGEHLGENVQKVGVFVDASIEEILDVIAIVGLTGVQLHGEEPPEFIERLKEKTKVPIIKAFRIGSDFMIGSALDHAADAVLLDAFSLDEPGGTGKTADWQVAREVCIRSNKVYLAGGLSAENVGAAIREVKPFAVDACSMLESSPGKKDAEKVKDFIKAVRETE